MNGNQTMREYIKPRCRVVHACCTELICESADAVEFTFTTSVDDDWDDNREIYLE